MDSQMNVQTDLLEIVRYRGVTVIRRSATAASEYQVTETPQANRVYFPENRILSNFTEHDT